MSAINADNRDAWQAIANDVSKQRPSEGKMVRVTHGRRKGLVGTVLLHRRDQWSDAFRYGSDGNLHLREMAGRHGFVCKIRPDDDSKPVWVKADRLEVIETCACCRHPLDEHTSDGCQSCDCEVCNEAGDGNA